MIKNALARRCSRSADALSSGAGNGAGQARFLRSDSWIVSVHRLATALMTMMADGRP